MIAMASRTKPIPPAKTEEILAKKHLVAKYTSTMDVEVFEARETDDRWKDLNWLRNNRKHVLTRCGASYMIYHPNRWRRTPPSPYLTSLLKKLLTW